MNDEEINQKIKKYDEKIRTEKLNDEELDTLYRIIQQLLRELTR